MSAKKTSETPDGKNYVFTVQIMIKDETNGKALEQLVKRLNDSGADDYRVVEGVEVGQRIEDVLKNHVTQVLPVPGEAASPAKGKADRPGKGAAAANRMNEEILDRMNDFKSKGTLVRLHILKGKGVRLSLPCRIIGIDEDTGSLTVYHVDEKKVYLLQLPEIEDITT